MVLFWRIQKMLQTTSNAIRQQVMNHEGNIALVKKSITNLLALARIVKSSNKIAESNFFLADSRSQSCFTTSYARLPVARKTTDGKTPSYMRLFVAGKFRPTRGYQCRENFVLCAAIFGRKTPSCARLLGLLGRKTLLCAWLPLAGKLRPPRGYR